MDSPRKLIVGYDLCEDASQISCFSYKSYEPVPISQREGEEEHSIPTVLCLRESTKQWLFGEEAVKCAQEGAGILVDNILEKVQKGQDVEILGQTYSGAALLEIFLWRTLLLIKNYFPTEPITKMVITLRETQPELVERIYGVLRQLGLEKDRVSVMNHSGAYLYYALSQDKSLWMNDVGMFDFTKEGLSFYRIQMNRRSTPMAAVVVKTDYKDQLNQDILLLKREGRANPEYILENIINSVVYRQVIATLYFTGEGFEGGWAGDTIKSFCVGRRVFIGQNLYTNGACYAAKELSGNGNLDDFILLNEDMVTSSLMIKVYTDTKYQDLELLRPGENWYEVHNSVEVIVDGDINLDIIKKSILSKDMITITHPLTDLPERENRMTRIMIEVSCKAKDNAIVRVTDLGFGEICPAKGDMTEVSIEI